MQEMPETLNSKMFRGNGPGALKMQSLDFNALDLNVRPLSINQGPATIHYDVIRAPKNIFCPGPHTEPLGGPGREQFIYIDR